MNAVNAVRVVGYSTFFVFLGNVFATPSTRNQAPESEMPKTAVYVNLKTKEVCALPSQQTSGNGSFFALSKHHTIKPAANEVEGLKKIEAQVSQIAAKDPSLQPCSQQTIAHAAQIAPSQIQTAGLPLVLGLGAGYVAGCRYLTYDDFSSNMMTREKPTRPGFDPDEGRPMNADYGSPLANAYDAAGLAGTPSPFASSSSTSPRTGSPTGSVSMGYAAQGVAALCIPATFLNGVVDSGRVAIEGIPELVMFLTPASVKNYFKSKRSEKFLVGEQVYAKCGTDFYLGKIVDKTADGYLQVSFDKSSVDFVCGKNPLSSQDQLLPIASPTFSITIGGPFRKTTFTQGQAVTAKGSIYRIQTILTNGLVKLEDTAPMTTTGWIPATELR